MQICSEISAVIGNPKMAYFLQFSDFSHLKWGLVMVRGSYNWLFPNDLPSIATKKNLVQFGSTIFQTTFISFIQISIYI